MTTTPRPNRDLVAVILAVGLATALNMITFAVLYAAVFNRSDVSGGLSENATQVLTGWGGGVIGILGAVFGYRAGQATPERRTDATETGRGTTNSTGMDEPPETPA